MLLRRDLLSKRDVIRQHAQSRIAYLSDGAKTRLAASLIKDLYKHDSTAIQQFFEYSGAIGAAAAFRDYRAQYAADALVQCGQPGLQEVVRTLGEIKSPNRKIGTQQHRLAGRLLTVLERSELEVAGTVPAIQAFYRNNQINNHSMISAMVNIAARHGELGDQFMSEILSKHQPTELPARQALIALCRAGRCQERHVDQLLRVIEHPFYEARFDGLRALQLSGSAGRKALPKLHEMSVQQRGAKEKELILSAIRSIEMSQ